ncbi:antibiotic biosynthesis monooxygenase family protein [Pseudoneobacillus rhizosphaerae]|uniref:Heme-degrading monooxygenase HmoB n=1 Tax=Pseudoneobacillus rhizosphaerae TaxID=2880968 RepID=A0A9C7LBL4_9BACI|nr:antibiotic biosynthesis monooxygenase [Pseudoneobacillus rhizosphaerae]CAG9609267.1 Heme-degrading monooxygenase HmoB [Pseudoneobacillus rhizosphaerae]
MYIYITTGTYEFLRIIKEKHPNDSFLLMENMEHALLLHETNGVTVFKTSRNYEVFESNGPIPEKGFVALNHVPITEEGKPLFEHHIKKLLGLGMNSIRMLRPLKSNVYIILTIWENELAFKTWQMTKTYNEAFSMDKSNLGVTTTANLFSSNPYISTYFIKE